MPAPSACDTTHAVACGIEDAAAEPVVDAQPFCTPAHQAHPVLASPVPAFIAMTLGSPVMEPQPAGAKQPQVLHRQPPHQTSESSAVITAPS